MQQPKMVRSSGRTMKPCKSSPLYKGMLLIRGLTAVSKYVKY